MTPQPATIAHLVPDQDTIDETLAAVFAAHWHDPGSTPAQLQSQRQAAAAFIAELRPRTPVEAAYAARTVAAHYGAVECFRRGMLPDLPDNLALRWSGRATALSRMSLEMARELQACQAAAPRAQPQPQPQPAARPAIRQPPVPAAVARPAAAAAVAVAIAGAGAGAGAGATKPAGTREPMPSERPSFVRAASAIVTEPAAASILSAPPARQSVRAELLGSAADVAAMLATINFHTKKRTGAQAGPRAPDPRYSVSSQRLSSAPDAATVTARPSPAAPVLSAPPPRAGPDASVSGTGVSGSSPAGCSLAGDRLAAAPA